MYERHILLGFIRLHILYHATDENGVYGLGLIDELETHGYHISPGTLYPILHEMKQQGLLNQTKHTINGKIRKHYTITTKGKQTLKTMKHYLTELAKEVLS